MVKLQLLCVKAAADGNTGIAQHLSSVSRLVLQAGAFNDAADTGPRQVTLEPLLKNRKALEALMEQNEVTAKKK
jgi:hypothetical protein